MWPYLTKCSGFTSIVHFFFFAAMLNVFVGALFDDCLEMVFAFFIFLFFATLSLAFTEAIAKLLFFAACAESVLETFESFDTFDDDDAA